MLEELEQVKQIQRKHNSARERKGALQKVKSQQALSLCRLLLQLKTAPPIAVAESDSYRAVC